MGRLGGRRIALAVILSSIGALNGWTLMMGQVPMAAAQDRLFPPAFGRLSGRGVPAVGIVHLGRARHRPGGFPGIGLARRARLLQPGGQLEHDGGGHSLRVLRAGGGPGRSAAAGSGAKAPRIGAVEIIAFVFSVFTVYGCGAEAVLYGLLLLLLGIPVYVWQRQRTLIIEVHS